jgi:threonine/homoserine/homoserine lactone efflux protein
VPDAVIVLAQSLLIGLAIAAPVGPIGLLVIQRSLLYGRSLGLATGMGAAVADAIYGAVAAFGVTSVIGLLQGARTALALLGGAFLLGLAWRTWHAAPPAPVTSARTPARGLAVAFAGTLLLTLSNPATILSFIAVFGAWGARGTPVSPWLVVTGVLLGSATWWLLLCTVVAALRERFDAGMQRVVNRASATVLAAFALWQWLHLLAR